MPNGYTAPIYDGTNTDPIDYLKRYARAFGAFVLQRDEAITDELPVLPSTVEEDNYYRESAAKAKVKLAELQRLTPTDIAARFALAKLRWDRDEEERALAATAMQGRYESVLAVVERFVPPSPDHVEFKRSAIKGLQESMRFDVGSTTPTPFPHADHNSWYAEQIAAATRSVERAEEALVEEIERVEGRYRWATQLTEAIASLAVDA